MLFPPMGRIIPSIGNFEIKSRTQAINGVTQIKYRKLAANRKKDGNQSQLKQKQRNHT